MNIMKKRILKMLALVCASTCLFSITGCSDKNKKTEVIIQDAKIDRLGVDANTVKLSYESVAELSVDENSNNGTVKISDNGEVLSYGNNGKSLGMGEVVLSGNDKSEYYIIDNEDIIYDGVRFVGLNTALDNCKAPYEKNNMINFIVKTFNPQHYIIDCTYENDELDDDNTSVSVDASLQVEYNGYASVVNKHGGKRATWRINLYSDNDMRLRASLVGCDKYILFRGEKSVANIDMNALEYKKPRFTDIPDYLLESSGSGQNNGEESGGETTTPDETQSALTADERTELYSSLDSTDNMFNIFEDTMSDYIE